MLEPGLPLATVLLPLLDPLHSALTFFEVADPFPRVLIPGRVHHRPAALFAIIP